MRERTWRLIESRDDDGFRNMAVDEALLDACAHEEAGFPCLRFYAFRPPCLSLGRSQPAAAVDLDACRARGVDVVRRPTGGLAVLHDREVTFSVIGRIGDRPFGSGVTEAYAAVARALTTAYRALGVAGAGLARREAPRGPALGPGAACFASPSAHEITDGPHKLAGTAQARRRGAFLQHGSLPLRSDGRALAEATRTDPAALPDHIGLEEILGRPVGASLLRDALHRAFEETLGARLEPSGLSAEEAARAEWLRAHRYLSAAWTLRR